MRMWITMKSLNDAQLTMILDNTKCIRDMLALRIAIDTGMRVGEIVSLDVKDIQDRGRRIVVNTSKRHPEGRTIVVESERLTKMLIHHIGNRPPDSALLVSNKGSRLSKRQLQRLYVNVAKKCGIPDDKCHIHILRHSYVRRMVDAKNTTILRQRMGHKNFRSTSYYVDR